MVCRLWRKLNRISKLFNNPDIEKIIRTEYPEGSYDVVKGIIDKIAVKGIRNQDGLDAYLIQLHLYL